MWVVLEPSSASGGAAGAIRVVPTSRAVLGQGASRGLRRGGQPTLRVDVAQSEQVRGWGDQGPRLELMREDLSYSKEVGCLG